MKLCLATALLLCSISSANANTCPLSNCNTLHAGEHYSINADGKYCINFNKENITVVNLSSRYIEIEDKNSNPTIIYPGEFFDVDTISTIANSTKVVISIEHDSFIVIRDINESKRNKRAAPALVWAGGGAVMGMMGVIANNPDANMREIAAGAFGGAVTGRLSPIMGSGVAGMMASGSAGLAASGGCASCH
ncbi:hypothetical protein [Aeromonas veronii]|uniref:hypothetical protein n=1 Tax=Aeromonas veronii TaxID=654 RepID=UPI00111733B9|nr:hypothetical protein [Aeromonas veronii]TNI28705.1 hypothetical protein CF108_07365 [Aeromonas veronii]